ncbi:MAG: acyltransferase [Aquabacterium sp.]|nr:acyltransferase [Aquabacterium sp.]
MTRGELNAIRGLACLLLVANHVVGGTPNDGLRLQAGPLREGVDLLAVVRMPLFACIAGLAHFHVHTAGLALLRDKVYRLLVPMLMTGTLFAVVQAASSPGGLAQVNWFTLHLLPVAHYWFLESLFIVFVLWTLARTLLWKAVFTACAVAVYPFGPGTPWLGIAGAFYLAPFFALGWWWAYARPDTSTGRSRMLGLLALGLVAAIVAVSDNPATHRMSAPILVAGVLACVALFTLRPNLAALRWVGELSFVIFLFHVFFTAPTRGLLQAFKVDNATVHLLAGMVAAVACSAVLRWAITRLGGPALWFIGGRAQVTAAGNARPEPGRQPPPGRSQLPGART